ncbi:MAG: NusG domain II-containing protein [Bacilli bacterium]|nr:NusG domain II-containing protein [Bacilli bacterium]
MDKKALRNDLILIGSLLLVAVISLVILLSTRTTNNLIAKVYVQDSIVETINLSKKEEKDYTVHGINGDLTLHTRDGAICVLKSNCPHQDCVNMGYVSMSNKPIICAYNAVYIVIEGNATFDVEI